jgi:hypothetical protein
VRLSLALAAAALLACAFGSSTASAAVVDLGPLASISIAKADDGAPTATTRAASGIDSDGAKLNGKINPQERPTSYHFDWGLSATYGSMTPETPAGKGESGVAAAATLTGLQPDTTYHFRVVAKSDKGTTNGADLTFTTRAAADDPATPGGDDPATPSGDDPATPPGGDLGSGSEPQLGEQFAAAPATGSVLVDEPGPAGFKPLPDGAAVPVGSVVDARRGTVAITTELDSGRTQTARFWGAVFKVRQRSDEGGLTEIVLRDALPSCRAPASAGKIAASASRKRRRHGLWGRDTRGRWRTRGRGSQASTRGTRWYTEERCEGTYTKVTEGAVEVRDFRAKRTVLVKAGHSYLARTRAHH